jgi:pimeloyl-ACP methyl ester carboxylesterase
VPPAGSRGPAHEAAIAYRDWDIDLASLRTPVHIWLGDENIFVSRAMGAYMERAIPGVDFHWVEGAGHFDLGRWDDILAACRTHA